MTDGRHGAPRPIVEWLSRGSGEEPPQITRQLISLPDGELRGRGRNGSVIFVRNLRAIPQGPNAGEFRDRKIGVDDDPSAFHRQTQGLDELIWPCADGRN